MQDAEVLDIFHRTGALLEGHFELRSGLHSDRFFQCAMVLRYPRQAEKLCAALAEGVRRKLGDGARIDGVIAPAMGGLFVGHEVAKALDVLSIFAEKENGRLVLRRGFVIRPGERYLVAEDVITRGGRVQGTRGIWMEDNRSIYIDGRTPAVPGYWTHVWESDAPYMREYEHPLWQAYTAFGERGGHGGMDYLVMRAFIEALHQHEAEGGAGLRQFVPGGFPAVPGKPRPLQNTGGEPAQALGVYPHGIR